MLVVTFNLKQTIINFAGALLKYLAKKMCPTRLASCPVNIKHGLTNALIRGEKLLQACHDLSYHSWMHSKLLH